MINLKQFEFMDDYNRKGLSLTVLQNLAAQAGLPDDPGRDKKNLLRRLVQFVQSHEIPPEPGTVTDRYAGPNTRCRHCFFRIMINGTQRIGLGGNKFLISRFLKCLGPNEHRYCLKEVIEKTPLVIQDQENAADAGRAG